MLVRRERIISGSDCVSTAHQEIATTTNRDLGGLRAPRVTSGTLSYIEWNMDRFSRLFVSARASSKIASVWRDLEVVCRSCTQFVSRLQDWVAETHRPHRPGILVTFFSSRRATRRGCQCLKTVTNQFHLWLACALTILCASVVDLPVRTSCGQQCDAGGSTLKTHWHLTPQWTA